MLIKRFESNFYLQFYIRHNKTVFFNTINSHIEIIYEKQIARIKSNMHWNS